MPARSNAFQRAMFLLRQSLADAETEVTESAFLLDPRTGTPREVDILVRRRVAGTEIRIGIECTDLNSPADVGWVEKMHGKHSHLPTHALILASGSGFTREAQRVAEALNVETVLICDVGEGLANKVVGVLGKVYAKVSQTTIIRVQVTLEEDACLAEETIAAAPDQLVCDEDGQELGALLPIVLQLLQTGEVTACLLRDALPDHKYCVIGMREPVFPGTATRLYLRRVEPGLLQRMKSLEVHASLTLLLWEIPLRHATVDGRHVAWGESASAHDSSTATLLVDETPGDSSAVLHVGTADEIAKKKAKRREPE